MGDKTVYILGAGFSKSADAPLQSEIIEGILSINEDDLRNLYKDFEKLRDLFDEWKKDFEYFLSEVFFLNNRKYRYLSLEDIYTTIDRSILNNTSLKNIPKDELFKYRKSINALITTFFATKIKNNLRVKHIRQFAKFLIRERIKDFYINHDFDPLSVISTNWDIILENALIPEMDLSKGMIDYCFYTHSFKENELGKKLRSGLYARGFGNYNLKILKLHGSMNWLQCQECQRIYIDFFNHTALDHYIDRPNCYHCVNIRRNDNIDKGAYLNNVLITPTYLKDLNNFQLKLTWQIAGIELQEASKIVFMGYSFPLADFELRHLLATSIRNDAEIHIVLHQNDKPKIHTYKYFPAYRYRTFWGKRNIKFFYDGVEGYINENC